MKLRNSGLAAAALLFFNKVFDTRKHEKHVPTLLNRRAHFTSSLTMQPLPSRYMKSSAKTDFKEFPGRAHWIIAQEGWEEVAGYIENWLATFLSVG